MLDWLVLVDLVNVHMFLLLLLLLLLLLDWGRSAEVKSFGHSRDHLEC